MTLQTLCLIIIIMAPVFEIAITFLSISFSNGAYGGCKTKQKALRKFENKQSRKRRIWSSINTLTRFPVTLLSHQELYDFPKDTRSVKREKMYTNHFLRSAAEVYISLVSPPSRCVK